MNAQHARSPHASAETLERGRLRRLQIVDAAAELFAKSGYRGTSLAGIAAQVGVTQAGLLHHFGSKEQLLEAVVRHRAEQDAPLTARIMGHGGLEMVDNLPLLAERNVERAGLAQLFTILVAENLLEGDPAHESFVERYRALRASIVAALAAGQERGEIRGDVDLHALSRRIVATLDGLQTQWLLDPDEVDLIQCYTEFATALRRELGELGLPAELEG